MLREAARPIAVFALILAAVAVGGIAVDEIRHLGVPEETTVTISGPDGTERGQLDVRVAASFRERYVGLSNTDSLGPNEGMLFVHDSMSNHSFVMRDMAFPIDIVFVGEDRRITRIHHAPLEEPPLTKYRGRSKWTIETPYNWTVRNNVSMGDRVRIAYRNET